MSSRYDDDFFPRTTERSFAGPAPHSSSQNGVVMFKIFLMRNLQISADSVQPYALVNFGSFTLRTEVANLIPGDHQLFEFDCKELLFKVTKFTVYQGYPPLRLTFFCQSHAVSQPDTFLGALNIPISHRTTSTFDVRWVNIVQDDYEIAEVLIGFFPVIPEVVRDVDSSFGLDDASNTSIQSSSGGRSSTWLPMLRKDKQKSKARKEHELVRRFVEETVSPVKVLSKSSKNSLLQLLDLLKIQGARLLFYNQLRFHIEGQKLSQVAFDSLLDMFRAVLRESNNNHDFYTCKLFLDLSMNLFYSEADGIVRSFLYSILFNFSGHDVDTLMYQTRVKEHEVFRNLRFWKLTFVDVLASERLKIYHETEKASSASNWNQMSSAEKQEHNDKEHDVIIHLLCLFGWQMLNTRVPADEIATFCTELAKFHHLQEGDIAQLLQFVKALDITGPSNDGGHWSSKPCLDTLELVKSPATVLTSALRRPSMISPLAVQCFEDDRRPDPCEEWTRYQTVDGVDYYHNEESNETRWDCPVELEERCLQEEQLVEQHHDHHPHPSTPMLQTPYVDPSELKLTPSASSSLKNSDIRLNGEIHVHTIYNAINVNVQPHTNGRLTLTNYRIVFEPNDDKSEQEDFSVVNEVPVHSIMRLEVVKGDPFSLVVMLKDNQQVKFMAHVKNLHRPDETLNRFCKLAAKYAWPVKLEHLFAFYYKRSVSIAANGWKFYHAESEYRRQGAGVSPFWRQCKLNHDYEFSPTYPAVLYVPTMISDDALGKIKNFRSKGRIPVLSYLCSSSGASILRSAQPRVGITFKRCVEDEELLRSAGVRAIIDARPRMNAHGNKAKGGGCEDVTHYARCALYFMCIENIHVMRDSFRGAVEQVAMPVSMEQRDGYLASLANYGWLRHVRQVLIAAVKTARRVMIQAQSVLVHCSDGWDRTSQITALAMLMMDPYYRTIRGFTVLIEKEWLSFGHKFHRRYGHGDSNCNDPERSPIFLQFLDCVWQLQRQFPIAFEFNEYLLFKIAHELFSCRFGTFLCNNERERVAAKLSSTTVSLWTDILDSPKARYENPFYSSAQRQLLQPNCSMRCIGLFPFYCRMDLSWHIPSASRTLERRVRKMLSETQIASLEGELKLEKEKRSLAELQLEQALNAMKMLQDERDQALARVPNPPQSTDWCQVLHEVSYDGPVTEGEPVYDVTEFASEEVLHTYYGEEELEAPPPPPPPPDSDTASELDFYGSEAYGDDEPPPPPPPTSPPPPPPDNEFECSANRIDAAFSSQRTEWTILSEQLRRKSSGSITQRPELSQYIHAT